MHSIVYPLAGALQLDPNSFFGTPIECFTDPCVVLGPLLLREGSFEKIVDDSTGFPISWGIRRTLGWRAVDGHPGLHSKAR